MLFMLLVVVEPIEITINIGDCEIVEVVSEGKQIRCTVEVIYDKVTEGAVDIYLVIPEVEENE